MIDMKNIFLPLVLSCLLISCRYSPITATKSTILTSAVFTHGIEGPATDSDGNLYVVNYQKEGTIGVINVGDKEPVLFLELPDNSVGNGIRFLNDSIFFVADYVNHNVLKVNKNSKKVLVHAHDSLMNQPNDITIASNGSLYASDPNWGQETGNLWLIKMDGTTTLLEKNMGTTNGVEVSPKGDFLYVNESVQGNVWKYKLLADGALSDKVLFHHFDDHGMDGMRCDKDGNLYIARYGKGTVAVLSKTGHLLYEIILEGPKPTNVAFSPSEKKLYVTMQEMKRVEVVVLK